MDSQAGLTKESTKRGYQAHRKLALDERFSTVTVDVFDTLLLRNTKSEFLRFYETSELFCSRLAGKLPADITAKDLFWLRVEAARTAYRMRVKVKASREANIGEIFQIMLGAVGLAGESTLVEELIQLELEYEAAQLSANVALLDTLKAAKRLGKKIVCISDMYMDANQITYLLNRHIPENLIDAVFSSADFGFGKSSGALYHTVLAEIDVQAERVLHCGDNYHADVAMAQATGLSACFTPRNLAFRAARRYSHHSVLRKMRAE